MISDQPLRARVVDLDLVVEQLRAVLLAEPGLVRLEPTVRSTVQRLKLMSVAVFQQTFRPAGEDPTVSVTDGLTLSLTGTTVNVHIDIATDIAHPALVLSERLQAITAETIQRNGLTTGMIDVTILAIEGTPRSRPAETPIEG
ncbi:hypothetical protein AC792_09700 [Arthrobacter sp. RIT-PI-e]|uniref:hypothetical protein n=1 Tax=Arthrobacter sp. RIT-PI-e TaxID=1681197 RepID=UPI0006768690|nr:hypothetical protein [Arthrobacter sp. RIT-PI-e]KNC18855.1 hypothetical protein AC792_09700 [Arthrobacter sp. RIT-PI-e]